LVVSAVVFAPAIAIACLQALACMFVAVAALALLVVGKQFVAPGADVQTANLLMVAAVFGALALGSFAALRALRRATGSR
jgi:hypothetical protein